MNFERGKEPKEAMRIGKAGNPFVAVSGKIIFPDGGKLNVMLPLLDDTVQHYLSQMKSSIPRLFINDNVDEPDDQSREGHLMLVDANGRQKRIEDIRGEYVLYNDKLYPICCEPITITNKITINAQW